MTGVNCDVCGSVVEFLDECECVQIRIDDGRRYLDDIEQDDHLDDLQKWRAFAFALGLGRRRCSDMREAIHDALKAHRDAMPFQPEHWNEEDQDAMDDIALKRWIDGRP